MPCVKQTQNNQNNLFAKCQSAYAQVSKQAMEDFLKAQTVFDTQAKAIKTAPSIPVQDPMFLNLPTTTRAAQPCA